MAEHYPTQSVAVLAGQGKVTGWKQPESNATGASSGVGDELDQVGNAQVVTTNKPGFNPKEEEALQLQKGPKKKYIDGNDNNNNNDNDNDYNNNFNNDANNDDFFGDNNDNNDNKGVSFASNNNNNTNNNGDGNGMDDFFAGMEDENEDDNNTNSNLNTGLKSHPTNATVISLPTVGDRDDNDDGDDYEPYDIDTNTNNNNNRANGYSGGGAYGDDSKANEETPLSLWEAERRKILQERVDKEKRVQRESQQQAEQDLQEFHDNRQERINKSRNDAKARENGIRQEYDSVYKNGTIWEQVAKLVDLGSQDESIVRMRDLLIELKNQGKLRQKS